ncbi:MAG: hypothetical protein U1A07_24415 [Phenylobacterium sp.]|nr:hypothetical protein [Phenylobacterium sp.]
MTMRARFIGDPRHGGEGPSSFPFGGVVFVKGEWLSDIPEAIADKVRGNSHFETEETAEKPTKITPPDLDGDGKPGGSLPADEDPEAAEKAELRAQLADLGVTAHHKTGLTKLRAMLDDATKPQD